VHLGSPAAAEAGVESMLPAQLNMQQHHSGCECACSCSGGGGDSSSCSTSVGECCGCDQGALGDESSGSVDDAVLQDLAALLAEVSACDSCCSCCQGV
jgi:hypothetical protein